MKITEKTICYAIVDDHGNLSAAVVGPNAERKAKSDSAATKILRMTIAQFREKSPHGIISAPNDAEWAL